MQLNCNCKLWRYGPDWLVERNLSNLQTATVKTKHLAVADLEGVPRVPWNPPFGSVVIESYGSLAFSKTQLFRL